MTLKVARGRGYQPASVQHSEGGRPIWSLMLDASFSPVQKFAYKV
jgi:DNA-directed RNA polymerase subunit alpha